MTSLLHFAVKKKTWSGCIGKCPPVPLRRVDNESVCVRRYFADEKIQTRPVMDISMTNVGCDERDDV